MTRRWWIKLLAHTRPATRSLAAVAALLLASSALDALRPWPFKWLVDDVLRPTPAAGHSWLHLLPGASSNTGLIVWLVLAGLLLFGMAQIVAMLQSYLLAGLGSRIAYALGARLLEHLQELSLIFHTRQRVGDLVRRVVTDSGCVRDLVCGVIIPAAGALASLVVMFVIMLRLDPLLAAIAVAFAIPLVLQVRAGSGRLTERSYDQQQLEAQIASLQEQTLTAIPLVQLFNRQAEHDRQFSSLAKQTIRASIRATFAQLQFKIGTSAVTAMGTATVMLIGGWHVMSGRLTIGGLLVFLAYLASLYAPMETLAHLSLGYASAAAAARRVLEVLDSGERVQEMPFARPLSAATSPHRGSRGVSIRFDHVRFGYRLSEPVLHEIDLEIPASSVVGLVGQTGAGKSTLASLVPRLFDPWEGRVCIDGQDAREVTLASLRQQIAIVPQEPLLLPLSVAQNIAYARPDASPEQIVRAAQAAGADEFIGRLPQGYDTVIGERGATLSAGQRQRLSIARALLKDSPILILDEPTSALDPKTEHGVIEALSRLMAGRTCLIIAHRLTTIRLADTIVVLDAGRIVEVGSHEQLILRDGIYRQLYELQAGRSAAEVVAT